MNLSSRLFRNLQFIIIAILVSLALSLIVPRIIRTIVAIIYPRYISYLQFKISIGSIGLRLLEILLILPLIKHKKIANIDNDCYKLFIFGMLLYFIVASVDILSRITEYFLFFEIILMPNLMTYSKTGYRQIFRFLFCSLYFILFCKDINSFSDQGNFIGYKEIYNYPYITIFNKDKILEVRPQIGNVSRYFSENP
jgi:hypothetical protein